MSLENIAKMHDLTMDEITRKLSIGIEVESEHTSDKNLAKEIAMDHLVEDPKYYEKLATIEEDVDGGAATPDSVPGMGAPVLPTRTSDGSGDVPLGITKPKKSKRVKGYDEFIKKLEKERE